MKSLADCLGEAEAKTVKKRFKVLASVGRMPASAGISNASSYDSLVSMLADASIDASRIQSASMADASNMLADASDASRIQSASMADASIKGQSASMADASTTKGQAGGQARAAGMTASERSALARQAAQARWKKKRSKITIGFGRAGWDDD